MSRNRLTAGLVAVFLFATFSVRTSAAAVADGDAALAKFDLPAAVDAFRAAHKAEPENYEAAWKLARALIDQGTLTKNPDTQKPLFVEAEQLIRGAVKLNPQDSKGHIYLAIAIGKLALFEGGKRKVELSKEIKAEADKAIELNPQEDIAYHVVGVWNREMAELNWVLKKVAEVLYGSFPPASLATAEANLQQAAKLAPTTLSHQVELGITIATAKRWTEAEKILKAATLMPKAWVTDEHYRALATENLERVRSHL